MNSTPLHPAIRIITVASVCAVAFIAAVVSYAHMAQLAQNVGEQWRSWLIPLSIDGLVVASSMTLLTRHRAGMKGGRLPWIALAGGVIASLAANMADAQPGVVPVLLAGWAPVAFAIGFELLLMQRRAELLTEGTQDSPPTGQPGAILPQTEPRPAAPVPASTGLAPAFSSPPPVEKSPSVPVAPVPSVAQPTLTPVPAVRNGRVPSARKSLPATRQGKVSREVAEVRERQAWAIFDDELATGVSRPESQICQRVGVGSRQLRRYRTAWKADRDAKATVDA